MRLPRSWLWLPGASPLALVAGPLLSLLHVLGPGPDLQGYLELGALVLLAVVVVCWLVTDARPAFALCLAVLLGGVMVILSNLIYGGFLIAHLEALLVLFAIVLPILLPAAWLLLRRQKTPSPRPYPGT